jgi:hypothetical protein
VLKPTVGKYRCFLLLLNNKRILSVVGLARFPQCFVNIIFFPILFATTPCPYSTDSSTSKGKTCKLFLGNIKKAAISRNFY